MTRERRPGAPPAYQVGPGTWVVFSYRLCDAEGEEVGASAPEGVTFCHGFGQLPSPLEAALEGAVAGESRVVALPPEHAFGHRDPQALIEVERGELPADCQVGDCFEAEGEAGACWLTVLEVDAERAVLDTNHPLAGQLLTVELEVDEVRPASSEELERMALSEPIEGPWVSLGRLVQRNRDT